MLKALIRNTAFTGLAQFASGVLGFLVVPVIIHAYGIPGFGLIVLARVILPNGTLSILDFGVSETATQVVARARTDGSWAQASGQLSLLLAGALAVGTAVGLTLFFAEPFVHKLIKVAPEMQPGFALVVRATSVLSPLFFAGLVAEGVAKGFERYGLVKLVEVSTLTAYAISVPFIVRAEQPFQSVALAFLAAELASAATLLVSLIPLLRGTPLRLSRWDQEGKAEVRRRGLLMFQGRVLGVLQSQAATLLIGAMVGPAGVGVYDLLIRLPRFAKATLALVASALLPVATRLDTDDGARLRALGLAGFWLVPTLTLPVFIGGAVFSRALLTLWIGGDAVSLWPWLSILFLALAPNVFIGFGGALLLVRLSYLSIANRLLMLYIVVQMAASLALSRLFQEKAFILGQMIAAVLVSPLQLRAILSEQGISWSDVAGILARQAMVFLGSAALGVAIQVWVNPSNLISCAALFSVWGLTSITTAYFFALSSDQRAMLRRVAAVGLGRASGSGFYGQGGSA